MEKILLWLLENFYLAELKEWKQKKLESDRVEIGFYKKYFSNNDYNQNKQCLKGCGRSIQGCRCIDKAFGY
jgi:hypothetical protein